MHAIRPCPERALAHTVRRRRSSCRATSPSSTGSPSSRPSSSSTTPPRPLPRTGPVVTPPAYRRRQSAYAELLEDDEERRAARAHEGRRPRLKDACVPPPRLTAAGVGLGVGELQNGFGPRALLRGNSPDAEALRCLRGCIGSWADAGYRMRCWRAAH